MELFPPIAIFLLVCSFGLSIVNIFGFSMMNERGVLSTTLAPISSPTLPPITETANESTQVLQDSEIASGSELLAEAVSHEMLKSTSDSKSKPLKATKKELFQQCKMERNDFLDQEKYHNLRHAATDFYNTKHYFGDGGSKSVVHDESYSSYGAAYKVFRKLCSDMGWIFLDANKLICSGSVNNLDFYSTYSGYATCIPNSEACVGVGDYILEDINDRYANQNYTNQECHYEKSGNGYYDKNVYAIDSKVTSESSSIRESFSSDDDVQQCQNDSAQMIAENIRMTRAEKSFFDAYRFHSDSTPSSKFKTYDYGYTAERSVYRKACTEGGGMFVEAPKPFSCTTVDSGSRLTITTRRRVAYCIADTVACRNVGAEYAFQTWNNHYMNQCSYDDDDNHRGLRGAR